MIQLNTIEGIVRFIFATKQGTYVLSVHMKSVKPAEDLTACGNIFQNINILVKYCYLKLWQIKGKDNNNYLHIKGNLICGVK